MSTVHLHGCRVEPLLSYLAGLGVVRLVAEQLDPDVSARWDGDHLVIIGKELDNTKLVEFLAEEYRPTPLIAPWNGRGGFQDGRERPSEQIVKRVEFSDSRRLEAYRSAISIARDACEAARGYQLIEKGKVSDNRKLKKKFIELCRATLPDEALAWLDASVVLLDDDIAFPLILGTGGNFGSMEISIGFLRQLDALGLLGGRSDESSRALLRHSLFRDDDARLDRSSAGQFDPGGVGGPNSSSTGNARELANPWGFVLAMEGAIVFASAAARRLGAESQTGARKASMPFTVDATGVAHDSASEDEELKGELWVPLWRHGMSYREIQHFISEGRSQWGRHQARSGLDFVRATATLGVYRSVDEFARYLISVRHGQNVLAVPTGRFRVHDRVRPEADVLRQLDGWVDSARFSKSPTAVNTALHALDRAQFAVATLGGAGRLQAVLGALAEAEQAASRSPGYREKRHLRPINGLSAREWAPLLDDGSAEFRIAVGLASLSDELPSGSPSAAEGVGGSLATLLRPVTRTQNGLAWSRGGSRVPNLGDRSLYEILVDVVGVRAVLASSAQPEEDGHDDIAGLPFAFHYGLSVDLADVGRLLGGQLDVERLGAILAGLLLLEWKGALGAVAPLLGVPHDPVARLHAASQPTFVVLAPFFNGRLPVAPTELEPNPSGSIAVRPRPEWIGAIRAGAAHTAARSAAHLLRGRGWRLIPGDFESERMDRGCLATALLLRLDRTAGDQSQLRFLLNQHNTIDTRRPASTERQEPHHEQA